MRQSVTRLNQVVVEMVTSNQVLNFHKVTWVGSDRSGTITVDLPPLEPGSTWEERESQFLEGFQGLASAPAGKRMGDVTEEGPLNCFLRGFYSASNSDSECV